MTPIIEPPKRGSRVTYWKSLRDGKWRYRLQSANHEWVGGPSESDGFDTLSKAKRAYQSFVRAAQNAKEVVLDEDGRLP